MMDKQELIDNIFELIDEREAGDLTQGEFDNQLILTLERSEEL